MNRRALPLPASAAALLAALALAASVAAAPTLTSLVSGLSAPIAFVDPDVGLPHRLIVQQRGDILFWDAGGVRASAFLDLRNDPAVPASQRRVNNSGSERGLLALTTDPNYPSNRHLYVYYTAIDFDGTGPIQSGDIVVERYTALADFSAADPATAQVVIYIPHRAQSNHNGGWLAFGADGYLYISTGDGGGGCDSTGPSAGVGDPTFPRGNAWRYDGSHYSPVQPIAPDTTGEYLLGKVLRLDTTGDDFPADPRRNYKIPPTNPYAGATFGADEIWARGLRNPFRFSFDLLTGDLWIGDVGQNKWEEINFRAFGAAGGDHYGWMCREGFDASSISPSGCSQTNCPPDSAGLIDPFRQEDNSPPPGGVNWTAIIGGYRYRGSRVASLPGVYLYSDSGHGDVWQGVPGTPWTFSLLISAPGGSYSFGEDHLGEQYLVNGGGTISCLHDGQGCFWALWTGLQQDGFETGSLTRWHATSP